MRVNNHFAYFQSVTFRKTSRNLARSLFWKNVKIYVIVAAILIVSSKYNSTEVKCFFEYK